MDLPAFEVDKTLRGIPQQTIVHEESKSGIELV